MSAFLIIVLRILISRATYDVYQIMISRCIKVSHILISPWNGVNGNGEVCFRWPLQDAQ